MKNLFFLLIVMILPAVFIAACSSSSVSPYIRHDTARRIATPAFMIERQISAGEFDLAAFERMHEPNAPASIYIEGDGMDWFSEGKGTDLPALSTNPTPDNPVGLRLATRDNAQNLAYIARPCQYLSHAQTWSCDPAYWSGKRFSPEVVNAYSAALDDIKARYDISSFEVNGYGGGGTIAMLLAAQRSDINCVRTVAANLDHRVQAAAIGRGSATGSLNPPDFALSLRGVPQYHFVGGQDAQISPAVLHSYLQAVGSGPDIHYELVQDAGHETGWVEKWPSLLQRPLACGPTVGGYMARDSADYYSGGYEAFPGDDYSPQASPIYTTREIPLKP